MRVRAIAALFAVACFAGVAHGQGSPSPAPLDCVASISSATKLNSLALRDAAGVCAGDGRVEDANFLLALAQFRATADLILLPPANAMDEGAYAVSIWIYYFSSSVGDDEFYATPENVQALEERLLSVELTTDGGYDPGWEFHASPRIDLYPEFIAALRDEGVWLRQYVGLLMQDDDYFAAFMALRAFNEAHRGEVRPGAVPEAGIAFGQGIAAGTPEYEEWVRLRARQQEAHERITPPPRPPADPTLMARVMQPEPEVVSAQVAAGFNGPADAAALVLRSAEEVRGTWLPDALGQDALAVLLGETDFDTQALVVLALGRQSNASGKVLLFELFHDAGFPVGTNGGYWISARLGTIDAACGQAPGESFPFVVGLTVNVPGAVILSHSFATFPDQCGPVVVADPIRPG